MNNIESMGFDEWLFSVCDYVAQYKKVSAEDVYSEINLTDAKLSYRDGISYIEYASSEFSFPITTTTYNNYL